MTLEEKIKQLPNTAGVYQYFDKDGKLLYIGKAKVLKNRVKSYFNFTPTLSPSNRLSSRIYKMLQEVARLEYVLVNNENDALILENSLIKQLKPKYNILLRDDKTYPYIYVDFNQDFPRLEITRKAQKGKNIKYFGPFTNGSKALIESIYETNKLVQKKSCIKSKKACLYYQINKCHAPCEGKVSKSEYKIILDNAISQIYNKTKTLQYLKNKLQKLSDALRFEEAIKTRDMIDKIKNIKQVSNMDFANNESFDLFCIKTYQNKGVIVRIFVRDGKVISSNDVIFNTKDGYCDIESVYESALINYYKNPLPKCVNSILLGYDISNKEQLQNIISQKQNKKITISAPKIGAKKSIIDVGFKNCDEIIKLQNANFNIYKKIQEFFNLDREPFRFESFDNSHMMGESCVGSMIVYDNNKFAKEDYRKYTLQAKDEYNQMSEMLQRRVSSFDSNPPPDVWVIDGGKTLLTLANNILKHAKVDIPTIAISKEKKDAKTIRSKGGAKDILYFNDLVFKLSTQDKVLNFFQLLRDEAHRSAILFHQKSKLKNDKQISMIDIKGVGAGYIKKLVLYFGTFDNIKNANLEELELVVNKKIAAKVFEFFKT